MSITKDDALHVAALSRVNLTAEEAEQFTEQLAKILGFVGKLNELNTDNVEPTSHVLPITNVLRQDLNRPSLTNEAVLKNAPEHEEGHIVVPAVLE